MTLKYIRSLTEGSLFYDVQTKVYLCSMDGSEFQVKIHDEGEGQDFFFNFDVACGLPESSWQTVREIDGSFYKSFSLWKDQIIEEADEISFMTGEVPFSSGEVPFS